MWTLHKQQQHCGAQLHARSGRMRQPGEAPAEATRDRAAQEHDRADLDVSGAEAQPGDYPASSLGNGDGDPSTGLGTGDARAAWDEVVQPERVRRAKPWDEQPLPEGK